MAIVFLEDMGIVHGQTWIAASWWDFLNASQFVRVSFSFAGSDHQILVGV